MERRERLVAELHKMQRRVDEFADLGELKMMAEYAQDVKLVQKKIVDVEIEIEWINQVIENFVCLSILFCFRKKHNFECRKQNIHN